VFGPQQTHCCIELAINSVIHEVKRNKSQRRKYIYRLKFCEVNRFNTDVEKVGDDYSKVIKWTESEASLPD